MSTAAKLAIGLGVLCAFLLGILVGSFGRTIEKEPTRSITDQSATAGQTTLRAAENIYLKEAAESEKKTCRANMQSIGNAAQAWKVKNSAADYSTVTMSALIPDLGAVPICPNGGDYRIVVTGKVKDAQGFETSIPSGSLGITCNHPGHNGFVPGVMLN